MPEAGEAGANAIELAVQLTKDGDSSSFTMNEQTAR